MKEENRMAKKKAGRKKAVDEPSADMVNQGERDATATAATIPAIPDGRVRWYIRAGEAKVLQQQVMRDGELAWEDIPIHADNAVDGYCLACGSQEASKHVCPASKPEKGGARYRCRCCVPCMANCRRAEHGVMEGGGRYRL